ncbi:hypothetical protein E4U19_004752 [Claviceps sp. Clav32 group G5]|nr:hypothetical protein E4U19_004752 [Claviceps sp. Clav32 group G5]KAG6026101.1 hypothetical protein E4U40_002317 [Claviceps sp. LM458 group G5]KAG6044731.1 hypothetical protein E4U39_003067 [Claviceps sp. Clav50 group G5]
MDLNLWSHQFCLACDKQIHADGAAYCSESCRLSDQETTSTSSSQAGSPNLTSTGFPWSDALSSPTILPSSPPSQSKFRLSPAYDFTNARPYGSIPTGSPSSSRNHNTSESSTMARHLSPSNSHVSLCSIPNASPTGETSHLSDTARQELKAYAISFEHVRLQRRRSHQDSRPPLSISGEQR